MNGVCKTLENASDICECDVGWIDSHCFTPSCDINMCNLGQCTIISNEIKCICPSLLKGKLCELNKCVQDVNCFDGVCQSRDQEDDLCKCNNNWTGTHCNMPNCDGYKCLNGGECEILNGRPNCACVQGFKGEICQYKSCVQDFNCFQGECLIKSEADDICYCSPKFEGSECKDVKKCTENACGPGDCFINNDAPFCYCPITYKGEHCEFTKCLQHNNCLHGNITGSIVGICNAVQNNNDYCTCSNGYFGTTCNMPTCDNYECLNGKFIYYTQDGVCDISTGQHECICKRGYKGVKCEIIECVENLNCFHGKCEADALENDKCNCKKGFEGWDCKTPSCHNYCQKGECSIRDQKPECSCPRNNKGEYCEFKKCTQGRTCFHGTCETTTTDDICTCNDYWKGATCNIPTCDGFICLNNGHCALDSGAARCVCPRGFKGSRCQNIKCEANHNCVHGTCMASPTDNDMCDCTKGYTGEKCTEASCEKGLCGAGNCIIKNNNYECICPTELKGKHCELDKCIQDVNCKNGICKSNVDSQDICDCNTHWLGKACDQPTCDDYICLNDGKCDASKEIHQCICEKGYKGSICQYQHCFKDVNCFHGSKYIMIFKGICKSNNDQDDQCICSEDYTDFNCKRAKCTLNKCGLGNNYTVTLGSCYLEDNKHVCRCPNNKRGRYCQLDKCEPGVTCINGNYTKILILGECKCGGLQKDICLCKNSWRGDKCEIATCENYTLCGENGTCYIDNFNIHRCRCFDGFRGSYCEHTACVKDFNCFNEKQCSLEEKGPSCNCGENFSGPSPLVMRALAILGETIVDHEKVCKCDLTLYTGPICEHECPTKCEAPYECLLK
ncbi:hypothetical protein HZS_7341, partial [Henneguya salminicola]